MMPPSHPDFHALYPCTDPAPAPTPSALYLDSLERSLRRTRLMAVAAFAISVAVSVAAWVAWANRERPPTDRLVLFDRDGAERIVLQAFGDSPSITLIGRGGLPSARLNVFAGAGKLELSRVDREHRVVSSATLDASSPGLSIEGPDATASVSAHPLQPGVKLRDPRGVRVIDAAGLDRTFLTATDP